MRSPVRKPVRLLPFFAFCLVVAGILGALQPLKA